MRYELRSVSIWALIKVSFFLNLIFGFIFGVFYSLILIPLMRIITRISEFDAMEYESGASLGLLFMLPILFALFAAFFNTIIAAVLGALYNLIAKLVGGFELNFEKIPGQQLFAVAPVQASAVSETTPPAPEPARPSVETPPPPPPYRPQPVRPEPRQFAPEPDATAAAEPEGPAPDMPTVEPREDFPVAGPHEEPDEDGPRQDNP